MFSERIFIALSALALSAGIGFADSEAFRSATSVAAAKKLGAKQITGESIRAVVVGRTLDHPNWTWTFKKDGSVSSAAKDKSWTTQGTWSIVGNRVCRQNAESGVERCSDVYLLGRVLKFTDGNKRKLAGWYVTY